MTSGVDPSALRAARERAGLTQHELARLVGAAGGERVSRWELGTAEPRPDFVRKLARVLHLTPVDLVRYEGDVPDLRALRVRAGLTVAQLVKRTNLSMPTYIRWESGVWTRLPEAPVLTTLAAALEESKTAVVTAFEESRRLREAREA